MSDDVQAEILAWLAEDRTRGYRLASRKFDVPASTIKSWAQAARTGQPVPRARARTREAAPEQAPAVVEWDPTSCTREEFLVDAIRRCIRYTEAAAAAGHGGVARQWETSTGNYRDELDALRAEARRAEAARGRVRSSTPQELASRILREVPALARVAPETAAEIYEALGRALGRWT